MPTITLRPDETFNQGDWWTVVGGPTTVHAATADNSDATYAFTTGNPAFVGLTDLTGVPSGSRIASVTIRVRWSGNGSTLGAVATVDNLTGKYAWQTTHYPVPGSIHTQTFPAMTVRPDGTPWTIDAVNHITVRIAGSGTAVRFYEVYADVVYNRPPTVGDVTPSGIASSQQPTIGWTFSDPDGDRQRGWQARVFTEATATSPGFVPRAELAVADSALTYYTSSGATSWTVPTALSPGVYRAYVRVADSVLWSGWATSTFTIIGDPPAPPALLSVTPDPAHGRVEIRVRQTDNLLGQRTATGDGDPVEYVRWYAYGNVSAPTVTTGGLEGNAHTATVQADGEIAITGLTPLRVIPGLVHIWAGWIRADSSGGTVHLDIVWLDADRGFLQMDEGSAVGLTTVYQPSEGRVQAPDHAYYAYLMWRSSNSLTAGQQLFWDDCGIWFTRVDSSLSDLEARVLALEDAVVDLAIRIAALEGAPPTIPIEPTGAPIDATAYRGGLDSSNLLGPADASFIFTLAGTNWTLTGPGELGSYLDPDGHEGYSLQVSPGSVGSDRTLRLGKHMPLPPQQGASFQFQFRCRANTDGLTADPYLIFTDGNGAPVGDPAGAGLTRLPNSDRFSTPIVITARRPEGATHFRLELVLDGETSPDDRWIFDRFQVARMPLNPPAYGFGEGPFGIGPFGGVADGYVLAWKPASQCDVYPLVEWSTDGGRSWQEVRHTDRAVYDPITRIARVYDYEAPLDRPIEYRARTAARDYQVDPIGGALIVSAPTTTRQVQLTVDGYWIVDPYTQTRLPFRIASSNGAPELAMNRPRPQAEFAPYGRTHKMLLGDVQKGGEFDWRIVVANDREWAEFEALLATGHTLLVQTPRRQAWYIRPGSAHKASTVLDGPRDYGTVIEFSGFEQERPV